MNIDSIVRQDRHDRNVTRIGRSPYLIRKVSLGFQIEDSRKWDPIITTVTSHRYAIEYVEGLLTSDRK